MYKNVKQGWYKLTKPDKFLKPIDKLMESFKEGHVNYKSSLELKAIKYCDYHPGIIKWSLEPFGIPYLKPTTNRIHRYFIDLVIEFSNGEKFLVEIKSYNQTIPPKKPKNKKGLDKYTNDMITYSINLAKWEAAKQFASKNGFKFIILTEKELK